MNKVKVFKHRKVVTCARLCLTQLRPSENLGIGKTCPC